MKIFPSLLLTLLFTCFSSSAEAASLADFLRPVPLVDIQISPDGQHLAMLRREAKDTLYIVKRQDNSVVTGVSSSVGQRFHSFRWANSNRLLIEPAIELPHSARALPTGALMGYSIDGQKNGYIRRSQFAGGAQMYAIVSLLPEDTEHILVARYRYVASDKAVSLYARRQDALGLTTMVEPLVKDGASYTAVDCGEGCRLDSTNKPTLEKLNVYTGKSEIVLTAPSSRGEFVTDAKATQVMFTGLDSGLVSIYQSATAKDWDEIKYFTQYYDLGATPIGFDAQGNVMALDNLVDTLGISQLSRDGSAESVFRDTVADIDHLVRGRDGTFIAASFSAGFPSWYYHEPQSAFAQTHKALRVAYPDSDIAVTSFTDSQREAVVRVYSDKNPGTYYVVNLETRKAEDLLRQIDWLEDDELVDTQPIQIPTRDNFEVYGYLTLPKDGSNAPPAIVITQPHPYSDKFQWGYDAKAQMFANAGYAVLQINTRGASGYGRRYTTGSDVELDRWTDNDLVDAINWAGQQELLDASSICLFGSGRGAYSAILTAMRNPDAFRCVVAADGEYEAEKLEGDANPARLFTAVLLSNRNADHVPWVDNLVTSADRLETPTLIVSESENKRVKQLLEKTQQDFAQHVIGVTNLNRVTETQELIDTYTRVLDFIEEAFASPLPIKNINQALHQLLRPAERAALESIMAKIYKDLQRAIRDRDSKNLPAGFERRVGDSQEKIRRAKRALNGRDKEIQKVLPPDYWPAYEKFKQNYAFQVEESIERGKDLPQYTLSGTAGR